MGAPQITIIVLHALKIGIHMARHDQPTGDCYNALTSSISTGIIMAVLYWGGFFN